MGFFRKTVTIEEQLAALAKAGLVVNDVVVESDLFAFHPRAELERRPFAGLVEVLGIDLEREPFTPICDRLWMCDFERIEDHGSYRDVIMRLERMTAPALKLTGVVDYVDIEAGKAWVEFDHAGHRTHWDLHVDNDWLDPEVLKRYDSLLEADGSRTRLYANQTHYGQQAFLGAFTPESKAIFDSLTRIKLAPLADQS